MSEQVEAVVHARRNAAIVAAVQAQVAERLAELRGNLAGWSEGLHCPTCRGTGSVRLDPASREVSRAATNDRSDRPCPACLGRKVLDVGYLVPSEPDPAERAAVRRELQAAIAELEMIAALMR